MLLHIYTNWYSWNADLRTFWFSSGTTKVLDYEVAIQKD